MPAVVYAFLSALGALFRSQLFVATSRTSLCAISWRSTSEPSSDRAFDPKTASFGHGCRVAGQGGGKCWSSFSPRP